MYAVGRRRDDGAKKVKVRARKMSDVESTTAKNQIRTNDRGVRNTGARDASWQYVNLTRTTYTNTQRDRSRIGVKCF